METSRDILVEILPRVYGEQGVREGIGEGKGPAEIKGRELIGKQNW